MEELHRELKALLIETLDLEDILIADIDTDAALFGEGLGLDSIDALEIGLELHKKYGVQIDTEEESAREHFASIASLAKLVNSQSQDGAIE
ncbi:MAG TPA: acyl carrier protein [Dehalococcoidia bacterium]|nr:acyl carrier protein [Dehalococcoidia bacterium]